MTAERDKRQTDLNIAFARQDWRPMTPETPAKVTAMQYIKRKYPNATWCRVSQGVYYGRCMSKFAKSWRTAERRERGAKP